MPVTDAHVAGLRALLTRDLEEYERLVDEFGEQGMRHGFLPLVTGAFFEAVEDRFTGKTRRDMIEWVARVRAERGIEDQIDPDVAERLLLWVFGKRSVDDLDVKTGDGHQIFLLGLLVDEAKPTSAEVEDLLQRARAFADESEQRKGQT